MERERQGQRHRQREPFWGTSYISTLTCLDGNAQIDPDWVPTAGQLRGCVGAVQWFTVCHHCCTTHNTPLDTVALFLRYNTMIESMYNYLKWSNRSKYESYSGSNICGHLQRYPFKITIESNSLESDTWSILWACTPLWGGCRCWETEGTFPPDITSGLLNGIHVFIFLRMHTHVNTEACACVGISNNVHS